MIFFTKTHKNTNLFSVKQFFLEIFFKKLSLMALKKKKKNSMKCNYLMLYFIVL